MDVEPKIGGKNPPKWMIKMMENPIKMDDLGVPLFLETSIDSHVPIDLPYTSRTCQDTHDVSTS